MDKKNLALGRTNFILIAVGMLIVIIGFILMSGGCSTETMYDAEIFNARRIKVAPIISFIGFISIVYAVVRKPADNSKEEKK